MRTGAVGESGGVSLSLSTDNLVVVEAPLVPVDPRVEEILERAMEDKGEGGPSWVDFVVGHKVSASNGAMM